MAKPRRNGAPHKPRAPKAQAAKARVHTVKHLDQPPRFVKPKRVHPRRVLPFIREGIEREFHSTTDQVVFHRHAVAGSNAFTGLEVGVIVLALIMAAGCARGLTTRLAEYR